MGLCWPWDQPCDLATSKGPLWVGPKREGRARPVGPTPCPHPLTKGTGAREVAVPGGGEDREKPVEHFKHAAFMAVRVTRVARTEVTVTPMLNLECASYTQQGSSPLVLVVFLWFCGIFLFCYPLDLHASPTKRKHTPSCSGCCRGLRGEGHHDPASRWAGDWPALGE